MAKKFVRGITGIKTINNQDFDTNNVNDLLSDGKNNYIHRCKGDCTKEYHCLTDNIKTIKSANSLLTVTNDNANNTATVTVNHDDTKQNKLTPGEGLAIVGNVIALTHYTAFDGNLNDITKTCVGRVTGTASGLPTGSKGNGLFEVVSIEGVCSQKYYNYDNTAVYIRTGYDLSSTPKWSSWKNLYNLTATQELTEQDQ